MARLVRLRQKPLPEGVRALAWSVATGAVIIYANSLLPSVQRAKAVRIALREANLSRRWLAWWLLPILFTKQKVSKPKPRTLALVAAVGVAAVGILVFALIPRASDHPAPVSEGAPTSSAVQPPQSSPVVPPITVRPVSHHRKTKKKTKPVASSSSAATPVPVPSTPVLVTTSPPAVPSTSITPVPPTPSPTLTTSPVAPRLACLARHLANTGILRFAGCWFLVRRFFGRIHCFCNDQPSQQVSGVIASDVF